MSEKRSSRIVARFAEKGLFALSALALFYAQGATLDCPGSTILEQPIDCVSLQMPQDVAPAASCRRTRFSRLICRPSCTASGSDARVD